MYRIAIASGLRAYAPYAAGIGAQRLAYAAGIGSARDQIITRR